MKRRLFCLLMAVCWCDFHLSAREVVALNEEWYFLKGPFPEDIYLSGLKWNGKWECVGLPHTWNATDMQVKANAFYQGVAYYRKEFELPEQWLRKRLFLRFEGVGACADVYVNGVLLTTHQGGYSAFACEITTAVKAGVTNEIVVKVDNSARPDVIPVNHHLFGVYGGIYRPVWLVATEEVCIAVTDFASPGVYISQQDVSPESAGVTVKVKLDNGSWYPKNLRLDVTIYSREGEKVVADSTLLEVPASGMRTYSSSFRIANPRLWQGIKEPYLYKVTVELKAGDRVVDRIEQPLGLREYKMVAGEGFYLNGEKYPMYGVTRHQDWWQLGSALLNEHHDRDLEMIMDIGATTVRFAHYQQSEYLYSRCDTLGLIVWAEIPFVNRVTGREAANAATQLRELIRQNFNHPSVYVWGLHNEVYSPAVYTRELTRMLHDLAKTEDPGRYTVAVNGYGHMDHPVNLTADIQGMNRYFGWYEKRIGDIKPWIDSLQAGYPDQLFVLAEYGADANIDHQTEYLGEALNWTKPFYPETFQTKTHEYQWSVIADSPYIIASYLWNMFDFAVPAWERGGVPARNMKGLVTFDRNTKKDAYFWYKANWSKEPVLYLTQRRNREREKQVTSITVYSNLGEPEIYLNGKKLENIRKGFTDVHYVVEAVELQKGVNTVKTLVVHFGKLYEDEIEWIYSGEKQSEMEYFENRNEHWGF